MSPRSVKLIATSAGTDSSALRTSSRSALHSPPTALAGFYTSHNQVSVAFGCEDGSIFTFMSTTAPVPVYHKQTPSIQMPSESQIAVSRKRAPMSAPHPSATSPEPIYRPISPSALSMSAFSNRSSSGTHTPNPLTVPSRARITQPGISRASIEAPKSHVEVGDEQAKLRAMLAKGSGPGASSKVRRESLGSLESFEGRVADRSERKSGEASRGPRSLARSVVDIAFGGIGAKPPPKSSSAAVLPTTNDESDEEAASVVSPSISESTLAAAAVAATKAAIDVSSIKMTMRCHTLPAHGGTGEAVTGLEAISDQDLYICLQASGTLSLLSSMDGYCLASVHADDLPRLNPPPEFDGADLAAASWEWVTVSTVPYIESVVVMIAARPHPNSVTSRATRARVAVYKIPEFNPEAVPNSMIALEKVGEWLLEADAKSVVFVVGYSGLMFAYINSDGHGMLAPLNMLPPPPEGEIEVVVQQPTSAPASSISAIPIPNPFNAFRPREVATKVTKTERRDGRLLVGIQKDLGVCWDWSAADENEDTILGVRVCEPGAAGDGGLVIIWTSSRLLVYNFGNAGPQLQQANEFSVFDVVNVHAPSNQEFFVIRTTGLDTYTMCTVDRNGNPVPASDKPLYRYDQSNTLPFESSVQTGAVLPLFGQSYVATTGVSPDSSLNIGLENVRRNRGEKRNEQVWSSICEDSEVAQTTAVLPIDVDSIFVARSNGQLHRVPFAELQTSPDVRATHDELGARVTRLWFVTEEWSKNLFVLGALDNGGIACWDARSLQLVAQWTIFVTELESVISLGLGDDRVGRLKGCIMAIAAGGTIAIIVLDGMQLLCVIPGSPAPLDRVCIGGDNLLLFYSHGLARLWDMKTHEFWRSMQQNKGEELLDQGGWFEVPVGRWAAPKPIHILGTLPNNISSPDTSATVVVDVSSLVDLGTIRPQQQTTKDRIDVVRKQVAQVVAALAPCGIDAEVDAACKEAFGTGQSEKVAWGLINEECGASSIIVSEDAAGVWKVSPRYTALRLLSVVSLLRAAASFEEYEQHVSGVIAFYVGCLAGAVGQGFQPPSLGVLAIFWVSDPDEVRQAARSIFESRLAQMNEVEVVQCVAFWREHLPSLQPPDRIHSALAVQALTVCGVIAASKHSLLPTSYVADIAKSVALYLHDEVEASTSAENRILSIELCSRGFQVWQHHVDAMEMLRALFGFAVVSPTGGKNLGGKEARAAVLQVAASSTPLFMTTLSLDITQPRSIDHRRATMQVVAFIIRKKPLVLYPSLPRLVEAVIKSLDPNSAAAREAIIDTATEILAEVVRIYPSVDFHMATQKLAVGTPEGAVVVYDLKTATRLYVLEGHSRRLTVLSFSPDGRRLATASLEESVVMVWKVGTSFSSWFAPGAPPRQGHGHGEPFKRLDFNVGDEAHMTVAATLEWVNFAWPTDRTARLSIRDSVLTFSC